VQQYDPGTSPSLLEMVMTARTVSPAIRAPAGVSKVNVDDDGGAIVSAETSMSFFFRMFTSQARKSIFYSFFLNIRYIFWLWLAQF